MLLTGNKKADKAIEKVASADKSRTSLYRRIKVINGKAYVTNGHIALSWEVNEKDGVYTLDGGKLDVDNYPDMLQVMPENMSEQVFKFNLEVKLPSGKDEGITLTKLWNNYFWAENAGKDAGIPEESKMVSFDRKYLDMVKDFFDSTYSKNVSLKFDSDISPAFIVPSGNNSGLRVILMPMRL